MKLTRYYRKIFRLIVSLKRRLNERVVNNAKFWIVQVLRTIFRTSDTLIPLAALIALSMIIYDVGFHEFYSHEGTLFKSLIICLYVTKLLTLSRFVSEWAEPRKLSAHAFSLFMVIVIFYLHQFARDVAYTVPERTGDFLWKKLLLYAGVVFVFITEVSNLLRFIYRRSLNPAFMFVISFALIILIGMLLLLLPNATVDGITPIDALFTSASAVCVTGLIVVDTATAFTTMGKIILLGLIQIGGLGIMTFTAVLSYLAAGTASFQSQIALKNIMNNKRIGNVIQLVSRILLVTIFFEIVGMLLIQWAVGPDMFASGLQRWFFSLFHSVSAFCNAGFSTLTNGLFEAPVRFNYNVHIIVALLIILGGMGFPIVFNLFTLIRIHAHNLLRRIMREPTLPVRTHIISVNSKLALATSFILLVAGFVTYLFFEQHASLDQHPTLWGKIVTAFFGSVTPRTAGFNTVDLSALTLPTVMIYLLLMWIGASPGSTGGGIKTTTAAVALLNLGSIIQGKTRTEIFRTQVSENSINRAFAVILTSLIILGLAVLIIALNDGEKGLIKIAFEVFSAFSTVGLTLGITAGLTGTSKIVLVFVMFIGRVGALTILMSLAHQVKSHQYKYPTEEIMF